MKNYLLKIAMIAGFALLTISLQAQPWMANITDKNNPNFFEIQKAFNDYWASKGIDFSKKKGKESEDEELAGWYQFKRWEWFMSPRVSKNGEFPDPMIAYNEYRKFESQNNQRTKQINSITSNWTLMGPIAVPTATSGQHGAGRLNCLAVNPMSSSILYVGSPGGGFWRSNNGGTTWVATGDHNATLGVSDIAVNPVDTSIVYIATGDNDANDTYSAGVLKSTNGGMTWNTTGLNWAVSGSRIMAKILIKPDSVNVLLAATGNGIMRSVDAGVTWTTQLNLAGIRDLKLKPNHSRVVYASTNTHIYRSLNGGISFSLVSSGLPSTGMDRIALGVTPADSNYVYALYSASDYSYGGVYLSTDGGTTFTTQSTAPNLLGFATNGNSTGGQGWYDLALGVSQTSKTTIMVGGINVWKSTTSGATGGWSCVGKGYNPVTSASHIHPDVHGIMFQPGSGTVVYCMNDGGIFKSTNTGTAWTDISSGLSIMEFYSTSTSQNISTVCIGGAQDNGCNKYTSGSWESIAGGDGMHVEIDKTDANQMYEELPNGDISYSNNGGGGWVDITPFGNANGGWVTPFLIDPTTHTTLYAGYSDVYKTTDQGNNWVSITNGNLTSGTNLVQAMAVAPSNSNTIYVAYGPPVVGIADCNALFKTTNGGTSWASITGTLPLGVAPLTSIVVKPNDPNTLWVTLTGYNPVDKIFKSTNGGATWTNVSGNLPNVPINCAVYVPNTPNALYVGTDLGVYYTDDVLGTWVSFSTNLPNVVINDLHIQTTTSKLRAGTYGRGMWETPMYITTNIPNELAVDNSINLFPNPTTGEIFIDIPMNENTDITVFNVLGERMEGLSIEAKGMTQYAINLSKEPKGIYFVRIQAGENIITEKVVLIK